MNGVMLRFHSAEHLGLPARGLLRVSVRDNLVEVGLGAAKIQQLKPKSLRSEDSDGFPIRRNEHIILC